LLTKGYAQFCATPETSFTCEGIVETPVWDREPVRGLRTFEGQQFDRFFDHL